MQRMRYLRLSLFCAGVALTPATQLRIPGLPIGPGELILTLWLVLTFLALVWRGVVELQPVSRGIVTFWTLALLLLLTGSVPAVIHEYDLGNLFHDLLGYSLAAVICTLFAVEEDLPERVRVALPLVAAFTVLPLLAILATGGNLGIVSVNPWPSELRFTGWARNANQVAMSLAPVPFVGMLLFRRATSARGKILAVGVILGSLVMGVLTLSDALVVAWIATGAVAIVLGTWRKLKNRRGRYWPLAGTYVILPVVGLMALLSLGPILLAFMGENVAAMLNNGNQASVRVTLWINGLRALTHSPLLGNGPGAYSGLDRPFQGSEAHNTIIDWAASTGLVGVLLYLALIGVVLRASIRTGSRPVLYLFVSLLVFSLTHHVLRHPLFWFYLIATWTDAMHRSAGSGRNIPAPAGPASTPGPEVATCAG